MPYIRISKSQGSADRAAGNYNSFTLKKIPSPNDLLLIEDADDNFNKKKISIGSIEQYLIQSHTWTVNGEVFVAEGDNNYICPTFLLCPDSRNIKIIAAIYRLNSGGTAIVSLKRNSLPILNYSNISVDDIIGQTIADSDEIESGDMISLIVNSVNANPTNMTFTIFYVYI